jgi:hypothetical protein
LEIHLAPEPGRLPFGELAGADFHQFDGPGKSALPAQMLNDLTIAQCLKGSWIVLQAALEQRLGFRN